MGACVG